MFSIKHQMKNESSHKFNVFQNNITLRNYTYFKT
jgi:hypothetical protein